MRRVVSSCWCVVVWAGATSGLWLLSPSTGSLSVRRRCEPVVCAERASSSSSSSSGRRGDGRKNARVDRPRSTRKLSKNAEEDKTSTKKKKKNSKDDDATSARVEVVVGEDGELGLAIVPTRDDDREEEEEDARALKLKTRAAMIEIYREHNPAKVAEVDALLDKYAGKEALLLSAIQAKYLAAAETVETEETIETIETETETSSSAANVQKLARLERAAADLAEACRPRRKGPEFLLEPLKDTRPDVARIRAAVDALVVAKPEGDLLETRIARDALGRAAYIKAPSEKSYLPQKKDTASSDDEVSDRYRLAKTAPEVAVRDVALKTPEPMAWYLPSPNAAANKRKTKRPALFAGRAGAWAELARGLRDSAIGASAAHDAARGTPLALFSKLAAACRDDDDDDDDDVESELREILLGLEDEADETDDDDVEETAVGPTLAAFGEALRVAGTRLRKPRLALAIADAAAAKFGASTVDGHPAMSEFLTRAFVADVKRAADADSMARLPKSTTDCKEVVLLGRSNVGKSSLVNGLLGRRALAPTSAEPGRTRRFVFYDVKRPSLSSSSGDDDNDDPNTKETRSSSSSSSVFRLVDVPGAGFAKVKDDGKLDSWRGLTDRYLRVREPLVAVLHLVDGRRLGDPRDAALPDVDDDLLRRVAAANADRRKAGRDAFLHVVALTKVDKLSPAALARATRTLAASAGVSSSSSSLAAPDDDDDGDAASADGGGLLLLVDGPSEDASPSVASNAFGLPDRRHSVVSETRTPVYCVATSAAAKPPIGRRALWRLLLDALDDDARLGKDDDVLTFE